MRYDLHLCKYFDLSAIGLVRFTFIMKFFTIHIYCLPGLYDFCLFGNWSFEQYSRFEAMIGYISTKVDKEYKRERGEWPYQFKRS